MASSEEQHRRPGGEVLLHTAVMRLGSLLGLMLMLGTWADVGHLLLCFLGEMTCLIPSQDLVDCLTEVSSLRLSMDPLARVARPEWSLPECFSATLRQPTDQGSLTYVLESHREESHEAVSKSPRRRSADSSPVTPSELTPPSSKEL